MLLSGMSTIVVTPPAAAARVALAKPSHSVRPGSLTWTWVSTSPGSSTSSAASVDDLGLARRVVVRPEGDDDAVADAHRAGDLRTADDRAGGAQQDVGGHAQLPR